MEVTQRKAASAHLKSWIVELPCYSRPGRLPIRDGSHDTQNSHWESLHSPLASAHGLDIIIPAQAKASN